MKVAIIGSGAVGGFLGALLNEAGVDVTLIDINREMVERIDKEGIKVLFPPSEERVFRVKITSDLKAVQPVDLAIVCVKAYHTRNAANDALKVLKPGAVIMSVQNGAGNIETIADAVGDQARVIGAVFLSSVTLLDLNKLRYVYGAGGLKFGPYAGHEVPEIEGIAEMFNRTRITADVYETSQDLIWNKVMMNSINCVAAAAGICNHEFLAYPSLATLVKTIVEESIAVLRAKGISLPDDALSFALRALEGFQAAGNIGSKASMLQDLENGRRTEIDALNGMIVREGQSLGVPTPANQVMLWLVKGLEEKLFADRG